MMSMGDPATYLLELEALRDPENTEKHAEQIQVTLQATSSRLNRPEDVTLQL